MADTNASNASSTGIKELTKALCAVQAKLKGAKRETENPFFKSNYADLQSIWDACRDLLTANGFAVIQTTGVTANGGCVLTTTLAHVSGESVSGHYPIITPKQDPQGIGAAITYARRYALAAIVGVYQADDDGESAMDRNAAPARSAVSRSGQEPAPASYGDPHEDVVLKFGKHSGKSLGDVDLDYLEYLLRGDLEKSKPELAKSVKIVVENRKATNSIKVRELLQTFATPPPTEDVPPPTDADIPF